MQTTTDKPLPPAANDNQIYSERWPVREEYLAGRLGETTAQNELSWECVIYIAETWNKFRAETESYFSPGSFSFDGQARARCLGDPLSLRGAEWPAHAYSVWDGINRRTNGLFLLVKRAIVDQCEMRALAPEIRNKAKRAAIGRARLIAALPIVAEEVRLLDLADAA